MLPQEGWVPLVLTVAPKWQYLPTNSDVPGENVGVIRVSHWRPLAGLERDPLGKAQSANEKCDPKISMATQQAGLDSKTEVRRGGRFAAELRSILAGVYRNLRPTDRDFLFPLFAVPKGYRASRERLPAAIYSIGKPFASLVAGQMLAIVLNRPHVIEFHDPWTLSPSYNGHGLAARIERGIERWLVTNARAVIAKTEPELHFFQTQYPHSHAAFFTVPCGFDETRMPDPNTVRPPRSNSDGIVRIVHSGALSERRSPVGFLIALKKLLEDSPALVDKLKVIFVGRYGVFDGRTLPEWCGRLSLARTIEIKGWLTREDLIDVMSDADAFVVFPDYWHQIPAKIYEYLWFGRRILVVCEEGSESAKLVKSHKRGILALRSDQDSIERGLSTTIEQCLAGPPFEPGDPGLLAYSAKGRAQAVSQILNLISR